MKTTALFFLIAVCATLAGCIVIPERHHWWHEHRAAGETSIRLPQHPVG
jgi:hypothetical protein